MNNDESSSALSWKAALPRAILMIAISGLFGWLTTLLGADITSKQILTVSTFVLIICATLFFWELRLAIAFIGISIMLAGGVMDLRTMILGTELDTILFLIGMMTLVGVLKDLGLFTWLIQSIINARNMNGYKFIVILMLLSGVMPGFVDEVTSIVFVLALVFQVCDTLKLKPTPFVIMSVIATNIGSTGTMLGNPVGILVGKHAGLSFGDFIEHATPVMLLSLAVTLLILMVWYRKDIALLNTRLLEHRAESRGLGPLVKIPYKRSLVIMLVSVAFIASHHGIESALGLSPNTMLICAPLTIAGVLMLYRSRRARHYIEREVEWWTLLFFMMLFAVASALSATGVTGLVADRFMAAFGTSKYVLTPLIVGVTAIGSAFVDNIVFVASFIPIIKKIVLEHPELQPLWWALLFGSCYGGNITAIGSTANIVALGMLEKHSGARIGFFEWLKVGLFAGFVTCAVATLVILVFYFK